MKRLSLALYVVFTLSIGLKGDGSRTELENHQKIVSQVSNLMIKNDNNQNKTKENEKITNPKIESSQPEESETVKEDKQKDHLQVKEETNNTNKIDQSNNTQLEEDKTPEEFSKYLGYWQLEDRDLKYNDVLRGFKPPLHIVSINDGVLKGYLTGRINDNYSMNPQCTIEIQSEIVDDTVNFNFEKGMFGSGKGTLLLDDDHIEVEIEMTKIDVTIPFSSPFAIEGRIVYEKIPEKNLQVTTSPEKLFSYLDYNKDQIISELGKDYKIIDIDHRDYKTIGYYYPQYGLTFDFNNQEEYVSTIYCDETIEINGASSKMNFEQIKQHLGKQNITPVIDLRSKEIKYYQLVYKIYSTIIFFQSVNEDGKDSRLLISS